MELQMNRIYQMILTQECIYCWIQPIEKLIENRAASARPIIQTRLHKLPLLKDLQIYAVILRSIYLDLLEVPQYTYGLIQETKSQWSATL